MDGKQIILIDAYALIYRSYYAIAHLSNSKGQPSNAVYALAKFLLRVHRDYPSEFGAFVFDLGKSAMRLEIAPDYKAGRPPMPEELKSQIPLIRKMIACFGWPLLEREGIEADDIIAVLTEKFRDFPVRIITGDKDMAQLVNERVKMLVPDKKEGGLMLMGPEGVFEKYEIKPEQMIDYLSLIGDNSDNIPGIEGVGPKTASKLMAEFGDIPSMLRRADEIKNEKLREKIRSSEALLQKNIRLITLIKDIPDNSWENIEKMKRSVPDWENLKTIASELELKSILTEIDKLSSPSLFGENPSSSKKLPQSANYTPDLFSS
ncbi:MAG: hypothetical protein A2017_05960 [Lentisphaerae bacterium GWF2_44_16]|nr:MAG: hypothetical protein A2017_05960 [Lentisphaerae bacterium GWF2_44_16]